MLTHELNELRFSKLSLGGDFPFNRYCWTASCRGCHPRWEFHVWIRLLQGAKPPGNHTARRIVLVTTTCGSRAFCPYFLAFKGFPDTGEWNHWEEQVDSLRVLGLGQLRTWRSRCRGPDKSSGSLFRRTSGHSKSPQTIQVLSDFPKAKEKPSSCV